uniref:Olfactory receptor 57 n=1 Tax=Meteorus pulchricornis TaxID=51522 RepID=A0A1S5VFP9_9HYME|nr:olfactory receptor 57 [Meteorus pulchricornis]
MEPCYPKNNEEKEIQKRCDKVIKRDSLIYGGVTELAVIIGLVCSICRDVPQRRLTYKAWLPYDHDTGITYCTTYIYQYGALVIGSLINISYDTLVSGCMMQTCVQLEIFKHRMKNLCRIQRESYWKCQPLGMDIKAAIHIMTRRIVTENIKHHIQIFRFAESANRIFAYTIFFQYSVSSIVICNGAHRLSTVASFSPEFFTIIGYLMCMLMQILIFCYYGNVVIYKSTNICNEIYAMDWQLLNQPTKKSLLIIMARTFKPIKFTSGHIVVLSLRSFNKLMKLSYSVYNVLHQRIS